MFFNVLIKLIYFMKRVLLDPQSNSLYMYSLQLGILIVLQTSVLVEAHRRPGVSCIDLLWTPCFFLQFFVMELKVYRVWGSGALGLVCFE
jgi:hypothetical protein